MKGWIRRTWAGIAIATGIMVAAPLPLEPTSNEDVGCVSTGDCRTGNPADASSKVHTTDQRAVVVYIDEVDAELVSTASTRPSPVRLSAQQIVQALEAQPWAQVPGTVVVLVIAGVGTVTLTRPANGALAVPVP